MSVVRHCRLCNSTLTQPNIGLCRPYQHLGQHMDRKCGINGTREAWFRGVETQHPIHRLPSRMSRFLRDDRKHHRNARAKLLDTLVIYLQYIVGNYHMYESNATSNADIIELHQSPPPSVPSHLPSTRSWPFQS